jgi:putative tricarboxylic transport membrane protein
MRIKGRTAGARVDARDLATGILLLAASGFFALNGLLRLRLGTPSGMGPGFFPVMIAGGLALAAILIIVRAFGRTATIEGFVGARSLLCILGAPVVFALAIAPLGFVPTLGLTTLIAACGSRAMTWRFALGLTMCLTVLCTGLFLNLLQLPVPAFGPWLSP